MTKKGFFGSKDKDEPAPDEPAPVSPVDEVNASGAPSPAPGEMPERGTRAAAGDKVPVPHGETNPETVGTTEVNPHNEAAAQRPATLPNDAYDGRIQGRPIGALESLSDVDRIAHLRGWGKDVRLGGPRSADWELFDKIVGEDPEAVRVREAQAEAQRKALSGERDADRNPKPDNEAAAREAARVKQETEKGR